MMSTPPDDQAKADPAAGNSWSLRRRIITVAAVVVAGGGLVTAVILTQGTFRPAGVVPSASPTLSFQSQISGPSSASSSPEPSASASAAPSPSTGTPVKGRQYPRHTGIVSTTFWVGEVFDPNAPDGSQVLSTYDAQWMKHFGGCDGVVVNGECKTERRTASNGYFPTQMTPKENPFYLDLPFDDLNNKIAFKIREDVVPWAADPEYRGSKDNQRVSLMKNRWVQLTANGQTCYGQIQDAGPGVYDDVDYVFGSDNQRPASRDFNNAGMDVSPALNGCLRFRELDGQDDVVDWQFVDFADVPAGPWRTIVTTSGVTN